MTIIPLEISNSEIQTFKDCRRKWWLAYYRELGPKKPQVVGPLALGTRIHLVLEHLYGPSEVNPLDYLNELYQEDYDRLEAAGFNTDDLRKEQSLAQAMIEGFLTWREETGLDAGLEFLAAEEVVSVPLPGVPGVNLRGKMDQRVMRKVDGARMFRDWKTTASFAQSQATLQMDEQMKTYHLLEYLEAMLANDGNEPAWRTDGALYTMLRKVKRTATAKPPFYDVIEVHHNVAELRSLLRRVQRICIEIQNTRTELDANIVLDPDAHQFICPPRPSRDCTWKCPFYAVCQSFDDGSNAEGMLAEWFTHVDPHERYRAEETKGETE